MPSDLSDKRRRIRKRFMIFVVVWGAVGGIIHGPRFGDSPIPPELALPVLAAWVIIFIVALMWTGRQIRQLRK